MLLRLRRPDDVRATHITYSPYRYYDGSLANSILPGLRSERKIPNRDSNSRANWTFAGGPVPTEPGGAAARGLGTDSKVVVGAGLSTPPQDLLSLRDPDL
ncbi:hypothetical protein Pan189_28280 [Stratiformator vulcanicus]|uniref:Uncharacterized protein n=1 Tax=Stratiformator vulcanicus TaxID=2527980 RepID=A0A517R3J0_9PLAN|nr:hypothetical protein Pan189_28280 [Stratiformator vulcanicus]